MNTVLTATAWALLQEMVNRAADLNEPNRAAYLDTACHGQPKMRQRAESLLAALSTEQSIFSPAIRDAVSFVLDPELPSGGGRIGPYRIVRAVGRGAMGIVYEPKGGS